jgi:hypothetical protein
MENTFFHYLNEIERTTATNHQPWESGHDFPADTFLEDDHYVASNEYEPWQNDYSGFACDQAGSFAGDERAAEHNCL